MKSMAPPAVPCKTFVMAFSTELALWKCQREVSIIAEHLMQVLVNFHACHAYA